MAEIAEVVQRTPGAAFAVDEQLRIVAWNQAAERALGVAGPDALGATCYELVPAVDADSGRPCYEQCPLVGNRPWHGWVHSRVLKAAWQGQAPIRLDCMLLRYSLPSAERGTLSLMAPLGTLEAEKYLRLLSIIERLHPVMSRSVDLDRSFNEVLRAVLQATGAGSSELTVLAPDTGGPGVTFRQVSDSGIERCRSATTDRTALLELLAGAPGALVVLRPPLEQSAAGRDRSWCLAAPVVAEDRLLAILNLESRDADFSIGLAARVLFAVAAQLSILLRWALPRDSSRSTLSPSSIGTEASPVRAYCFGCFRVTLDGVEIPPTGFKRQKSRTLLTLLVSQRGRAFRREALAELLWPEADPALSSKHLRVVLHDLRRALEPNLRLGQRSSFISSEGDLVFLDRAARWWVDVEEFERLVGEFDTALVRGQVDEALDAGRAAATLYRGDFLEEEPYDDWCLAERERLRERYLDLQLRLSTLLADRARLGEAVDACRLALAADPLRERTHRQLMRLLWKSGARDAALRQYEACRRTLREELDVRPDQRTYLLYRAILGNDYPASPPPSRPV